MTEQQMIKLTREQAIRVATNAINASVAVGLGAIHFQPKKYSSEEIEPYFREGEGSVWFDYFNGRMVKLTFFGVKDGYEIQSGKANVEYQSWAEAYPTYEDLVDSI